jgi:hypothetical protein
MNRTFCRKADRLWGYGVGLWAARVRLGTGQCQGETPSQFLRLTIACKRPPIAYARSSLRLSAAPEAWRSAPLLDEAAVARAKSVIECPHPVSLRKVGGAL